MLEIAARIDLLKADCEGGQHALVWETTPSDWKTVRAVVMEYHLGFNTGYPSDASHEVLAGRLRELGFEVGVKPSNEVLVM